MPADWLQRWRLRPDPSGQPVAAGRARISFVLQDGVPAVLKLIPPHSDEKRAAAALDHYGGVGAVRVLAHDEGAILLERAMPGAPLSCLTLGGDDVAATSIAGDVMRLLHRRGLPARSLGQPAFPAVEMWETTFARYLSAPVHSLVPAPLAALAARKLAALCQSQGPRVLLHGDLHHDNIVDGGARGWLAIDPKGIIGEPACEAGAYLRNPAGAETLVRTPWAMQRRVDSLAAALATPHCRILRWAFVQTILSALWHIEDGDDDVAIGRAVETALAMHQLLNAQAAN